MTTVPNPAPVSAFPAEGFRQVAEALCLPLAVIARDGRYEYLNPRFTELFGYTLKDVPNGREWFKRAFPAEAARRQAVAAWRAHVAGGNGAAASEHFFEVRCKDGARRHILFRAPAMADGRCVVVYEDVTDRLAAEAREGDHRRSLENLSALLAGFSSTRDIDELCRAAVERAPRVLGIDRMALWFRSDEPNVVAGTFGVDESGALRDERASRVRVSPTSLMGRILYQREPVVMQHEVPLRNDRGVEVGRGDAAIVAITAERDVLGCLCVDNLRTHRRIDERQAQLLFIFGSAFGQFYRRARAENSLRDNEARLTSSLDNLRTAFDQITHALASTVAVRDPYTAGHQERVTQLASAIGEAMRLPADLCAGLRIAGILHDIGKLQVPAEILSKPTRLTEYEYLLVQSHVEVSRGILEKIAFPWPVAEIVYQHHERLDGTGYPRGLAGDAIRIEARILAVADVVEAMMSHRPYRAALGREKAIAEVRAKRGKAYDAEVVDACIRIVTQEGFALK
jgi:PAS domain S-box-containing protein/putative nucleotidyltransferase with HDIG domain